MSCAGVTLIVLTGGASRRMGRDKASLDTGGLPLAARPVEALRELVDEVVLAGTAVAGVDGRVVPDALPGAGPLAAAAAALAAVAGERAVVVGCDMPAPVAGVVVLLLSALAAPGVDAAACGRADVPGGLEPLPLVLRRSAAPRLEAAVAEGARSLREGFEVLGGAILPEAAWRAADPFGSGFESWNRPGDVRPLAPPRARE